MTIRITDPSPKTYIVLGMHQGGTSIIAKALKDQGIDMGVSDEDTFEDTNFVKLNDEILARAGGSWHNPPTKLKIKHEVESSLGSIQKIMRKSQKWGFKDPRSALTLEHMLPLFNNDTYLICVFRKPHRISDSFGRVGKMTPEIGLNLTSRYYNDILDIIKEFIK